MPGAPPPDRAVVFAGPGLAVRWICGEQLPHHLPVAGARPVALGCRNLRALQQSGRFLRLSHQRLPQRSAGAPAGLPLLRRRLHHRGESVHLPAARQFSLHLYASFGPYFTELFPTEVRATGQAFAYNFGRASSALFIQGVAMLAVYMPLSSGMVIMACIAQSCAILATLFLPETAGHKLKDISSAA